VIVIKNFKGILTNYTHFKIKITYNDLTDSAPEGDEFELSFGFKYFRGLFACYSDYNLDYSILIDDTSRSGVRFHTSIKCGFDRHKNELICYLVPFGKLVDNPFTLEVDIRHPLVSKIEISCQIFPNRPEIRISKEFSNSYNMKIDLGNNRQDIVVNSLNKLPIFLGFQDLLPKEHTKTKIIKIKEMQEKFIVAKEAFEDLFKKIADIFNSLTNLGTNIEEFREENIEQFEMTREHLEQEVKRIIKNQNASDLIHYLINSKSSVKDIMMQVAKNIKNFKEEEIKEYFTSLQNAIDKYASMTVMFKPTRRQKIIKGLKEVAKMLGGNIAGWGVEKIIEKCF
jgi:ribosomal protein S20